MGWFTLFCHSVQPPKVGCTLIANYTKPKVLQPATPCLCGAYSLDTLAYCLPLSPTQVTNVGHPVDTLLRLPLALALVRSSLLPSEWSAVHLIVPNPSALTCQNVKEHLNRCADSVMQILGGSEQVCTPHNKENVGNSPRKRLTA